MGFPEAVVSVFAGTFKFSGRAPRSEYWWFFLFEVIAITVLAFVDAATIMQFAAQPQGNENAVEMFNPFALTMVYYLLLTFFPRISVTVRRLHDVGASGWFCLLYFVPLVGGLIVFIMTLLPSQSLDNKFGPPPGGFGGPRRSKSGGGSHDPMQGYASLDRAKQSTTAEMQAARKAEVRALYEQRVLGRGAPAK
ncbi:MAG: DUF805 domain-containing protein [Tateyamaria sp.]|uniref:DUF805 domain-containing protein n=1 Tax=Tateyamaria sp. TaxID=1929288 RepID=UPI00329C223F